MKVTLLVILRTSQKLGGHIRKKGFWSKRAPIRGVRGPMDQFVANVDGNEADIEVQPIFTIIATNSEEACNFVFLNIGRLFLRIKFLSM